MLTRGTQQEPMPFCSLYFGACDALGTGNGVSNVTSTGHLGSSKALVARPLVRNTYAPCLVGICVVGMHVVLRSASGDPGAARAPSIAAGSSGAEGSTAMPAARRFARGLSPTSGLLFLVHG